MPTDKQITMLKNRLYTLKQRVSNPDIVDLRGIKFDIDAMLEFIEQEVENTDPDVTESMIREKEIKVARSWKEDKIVERLKELPPTMVSRKKKPQVEITDPLGWFKR